MSHNMQTLLEIISATESIEQAQVAFEIPISETVQVNLFYERCWKKKLSFCVCVWRYNMLKPGCVIFCEYIESFPFISDNIFVFAPQCIMYGRHLKVL